MKRLFVVLVLVASISMIVTSIAFAQESEPPEPGGIELANLFTWARTTPPDWGRGGLMAGLGLVGALVTVFGLIGGVIPGTAGQAKIDADTNRLNKLYDRFQVLIDAPSIEADDVVAVEKAIDSLRDDLRAERRRQFGIAAVLYAILGAFFSALLAQDLLQALVIGAGWTGYIGSLGLKSDYAERASTKDTALERVETALGQIKQFAESQEHVIERIQKEQGEAEGKPIFDLRAIGVEAIRTLPEITELIVQAKDARAL
jgi:hypothetical protein